MHAVDQLELEYFLLRFGYGSGEACVEWATERLRLDQEGEDLDIVSLAGARGRDEVMHLVKTIIERYCGSQRLDDEYLAGKRISRLRIDYLEGLETIESVDAALSPLYSRLGYPGWLGMLTRNCEYATDIPVFEAPFEQEFAYIASLWASASSKSEFDASYDPEISRRHDAQFHPL